MDSSDQCVRILYSRNTVAWTCPHELILFIEDFDEVFAALRCDGIALTIAVAGLVASFPGVYRTVTDKLDT